ncbi:MAG: hypothetical protein HY239_01020 [Mycolicibacterium aromaticivorans]|nr:hypothetical protein [Mycolicibacterium aromaticivorans]
MPAGALSLVPAPGISAVVVDPDGRVGTVAARDIRVLVDDVQWESLTGRHGVVFWFGVAGAAAQPVNWVATQLLLATSGWAAGDVPVLRGPVVVSGRTQNGAPAALTTAHFEALGAWSTLSWRARIALSWRLHREQHRPAAAAQR